MTMLSNEGFAEFKRTSKPLPDCLGDLIGAVIYPDEFWSTVGDHVSSSSLPDEGSGRLERGGSNLPLATTEDRIVEYRTVVADPPWPYENFPSMRGPGTAARGRFRALQSVRQGLPYPSLGVAQISELPVAELAADDAALFLWTTNRYLPEAFGVIEAWGFTYTQTVVWVKDQTRPFVASVAPNHAEYLLVAKRGDHRWTGSLPSNVITIQFKCSDLRARHSAKPEAFLDYIETISAGPYLELFARRQRIGWDTWGDQALEHVELSS